MKKLFLSMITASLLVACSGGNSSSSGEDYINAKNSLSPSCSISKTDKIIFVEGSPNCKVNVAEINNGRTFTASCPKGTHDNQIYIEASSSGDLNNIKQSVQTGKPYIFACGSPTSLLSKEECSKKAKNRMEEMKCIKLAIAQRSKNLS